MRRKVIKASTESPNRAYSWGLLDFLVSQGLSKDQILVDMMRWFNADEVVECLESLARDYDIPLEDSIESCDVVASEKITASREGNPEMLRLVNKWYDTESYPDADPQRLAALRGIKWDINAEDVEYFLYDTTVFPDLTQIEYVDYFDDEMQDWTEKEGYDGGYIVIYKNGAEKDFAWYAGKPELYDVTEDATYMFGNQKYRDAVKNESFAFAMERYNDRIAEETYGNKWNGNKRNVDHDIYSDTDIDASDDPIGNDRMRGIIADELYALLKSQGNGAECKGLKTRNSYWLWQQETGPGFAIYFDDGNIWRDTSQNREPIYFNSLKQVANWLMEN